MYRQRRNTGTKHTIQVRIKKEYDSKIQDWKGGEVIETIKRVLRAEAVGNFNPIYCTYKKDSYQVQSDEGDLSDPFRREESYAKSLYIEVDDPNDKTPRFKDLSIGDEFDFINPNNRWNVTFFLRCKKISDKKYIDSQENTHKIGSMNCKVFNIIYK